MDHDAAQEDLASVVDAIAHLLPAQGPIGVFIHHNPLHAFEHLPFEDAVAAASSVFGCEPFMPAARYRQELASGRIDKRDVVAVLEDELGATGGVEIAPRLTRLRARERLCSHGVPAARGPALAWILSETGGLQRFRTDLAADVGRPSTAHEAAVSEGRGDAEHEATAVRALWRACVAAVENCPARESRGPDVPVRPRDLVLQASGIDIDQWVHPLLIRFSSALVDQGLSHLELPGRERGAYACFLDLYGSRWVRQGEAWCRTLPDLVAKDVARGGSPLESLEGSLRTLGIASEHRRAFLSETALALRGWAGIVRQLEVRPDRAPVWPVPARLIDFLAVRLLLERAALTHAASLAGQSELPLQRWLAQFRTAPVPTAPSNEERAWPLFHLAQLCALDAACVDALRTEQVAALEAELVDFDEIAQRRILHRAYERHLRHRFYDALTYAPAPRAPARPAFQAVFCIDEREESFRRHLEEVAPEVETFGTAGFFGVAMYFQGQHDVRARPLCPVAITPRHYVSESTATSEAGAWTEWRHQRQRDWVLTRHFGSRSLVRGAALTPLLGALSVFPLLLRVLFPRLGRRLATLDPRAHAEEPTRLEIGRTSARPPLGEHNGFDIEEMAEIVRTLCENIGATNRLSRLVVVIGHGSTSLNNPHESAHDCGACGGGRGGPNARALAQMANDPRVRTVLADAGVRIAADVWFVGAERNTCDNSVTFFDTDAIPDSHRTSFERVEASFAEAARREAHERCRRFEHAALDMSAEEALVHVQLRATDLAQPRPEYGHASNALCVVGRRARTRDLFLDRRAFLVSYDPVADGDGRVLRRLLSAVVPVVAGINLEYFFGYVDPTGYGCGTKLPHNVAGFVGVMDGAQSDLRTGLPWQMLEIHEPVRLSLVVESPVERLQSWLAKDIESARWVRQEWLHLACLDPESATLWEITSSGARPYAPERPVPVVDGTSVDAYRGRREHLPIAQIRQPDRGADA